MRDLSGTTFTGVRGDAMSMKSASFYSRSRPRSEGFSNEDDHDADMNRTFAGQMVETPVTTHSQTTARDAILQLEARLRAAGWQAMKDTLEVLIDEVRASELPQRYGTEHDGISREIYKHALCLHSLLPMNSVSRKAEYFAS